MKAAVFGEGGVLNIVQRDIPDVRPGSVRVAVTAVGICGTDLHMQGGSFGKVTGLQPGHEMAGIIDAIGDGNPNDGSNGSPNTSPNTSPNSKARLASGAQVVIEPVTACGQCFHCRTGNYNRCATGRIFGVTARGGMADFIVVPAACVYTLPSPVAPHVAALCEPATVCVRGVRLGHVGIGDAVAVLGAGTIGLMSILAAKAAGANEVFVSARHPHQAELARYLGATQVFESGAALASAVGDDAIDVVIETVGGKATTLTDAVGLVRRGGTIVMLGVFDDSPSVPGLAFSTKEITLVGSNCYGHGPHRSDFAIGVQLVHRHRDVLGVLVTHRFALDQVVQAFATAADKASGSIKVQIEP